MEASGDRPDEPTAPGAAVAVEPEQAAQELVTGPPPEEPADWRWVEQWRAGGEPTPWGPGAVLTLFTGLLVAIAIYVLTTGLADRPLLAFIVNVIVAGGVAPAVWLSRRLPVLRWVAGGILLGVLFGWASVLIFLTG